MENLVMTSNLCSERPAEVQEVMLIYSNFQLVHMGDPDTE